MWALVTRLSPSYPSLPKPTHKPIASAHLSLVGSRGTEMRSPSARTGRPCLPALTRPSASRPTLVRTRDQGRLARTCFVPRRPHLVKTRVVTRVADLHYAIVSATWQQLKSRKGRKRLAPDPFTYTNALVQRRWRIVPLRAASRAFRASSLARLASSLAARLDVPGDLGASIGQDSRSVECQARGRL